MRRYAGSFRLEREFQPVQVSPVPRPEKRVVLLAPAERHATPAGEIIYATFIVQRQGLRDRPAEIGKFLRAERINALADG